MLPRVANYQDVCSRFRWEIPEFYNIGVDVCDRWAAFEPDRLALIAAGEEGDRRISFAELRDLSNQTANLLRDCGIGQGDRVGILLPQMPETAYSHIAAYKLGAIAIPLFTLFGPEALEHRLKDSGARAVITDPEGAMRLMALRDKLPSLERIFSVTLDPRNAAVDDFHALRSAQSKSFTPVNTRADDPALIIYTSGTTGLPKGALHAHRVLLGHLPGVEMSHDFLPQDGDRIWTPADWAWIGGLLDVLLPALHHGIPVIAKRFTKFTGEAAFELLQNYAVRNAFLPPTALKLMRAVPDASSRWRLNLRTVASGGETLGAELLDWGRRVLGVTINEFYGQTECNMIVSSCAALEAPRPGRMGRPVPGHHVDVIDGTGQVCGDGEHGVIAVKRPDPVMFLRYWNAEAATRDKFSGDWLLTGDQGVREADGRIRFLARDDDVINSAGYRIGPGEIEDCLMRHQAVQIAAVIGKPHPERGEIVKAYIVLREGFAPSDALAAELADHVKQRLAAHEYPREVEFLDSLPMTTTGKIIRRELRERAARQRRISPRINPMITIRAENPADHTIIAAINDAAFGGPDEAALIDRLRRDGLVAASLVAEDRGEIAGHVLLSWLKVELDDRSVTALALAPLAVHPARQRQGIGSLLVEAAIDAGKCCGAEAMIVLGHPRYYPRFGFSAELGAKLNAPFSGPAFMALELVQNSLSGSKGKVTYPPAFGLEQFTESPLNP